MKKKRTYKRNSYLSRHCDAVRPIRGAIVRHCVGISFAKWSNFSSSSLLHSVCQQQSRIHECVTIIMYPVVHFKWQHSYLFNARIQPLIPEKKKNIYIFIKLWYKPTSTTCTVVSIHSFYICMKHLPSGLALFGWLPVQQRCNPGPLILSIFHNRRLENFILRFQKTI